MFAARQLKQRLNRLLERALHHRLEHVALIPSPAEDAMARLARAGFQPRQVADIGAAKGLWTKAVMPLFPSARFWLAEPLTENRQALEQLAAADQRAEFWLGAVGDKDGHLDLHVHANQTSCFASEWGGIMRTVPLARLDTLVEHKHLATPQLIKADVQGAEMLVIDGAPHAMAAATIVQLEVSFRRVYDGAPLAHDIVARMAEMGFRIYDVCGLCKRPADGALLQADIVFARPGEWFEPEQWNL
jgi:FkbM family methyltransferase